MKKTVNITINGSAVKAEVEPRTHLGIFCATTKGSLARTWGASTGCAVPARCSWTACPCVRA